MRRLAVIIALVFAPTARAASSPVPCDDVVTIWADGAPTGTICAADASARGLTVIELRDTWVPPPLVGTSYAPIYRALAGEEWDQAGADGGLARDDRYLELFGIAPALSVVRARLDDDRRHACHAAISPAELISEDADVARRALRAHLACDGAPSLAAFQRGVMILPSGALDADTLIALFTDSRERDFRAALRVLRERVVAATGLIEDGSAGGGPQPILGRALEPDAAWRLEGARPLDDAAPDLVAPATEAAARALGWLDPRTTRAFLDRTPLARVALALPPPPAYHGANMVLSVEIDRGDVWYDDAPMVHQGGRRPALIVYAHDGDRRIALVRWPTTIGGWQDEQDAGAVTPRWKDSAIGATEWRDLYVAPTWLAPSSTPDRELLRVRPDGAVELARETFGPSYRSAYGLIMLVHDGDDGIRTHATANLASTVAGTSHGCHRLLGVQSMRLADFLLAHRAHVDRGEVPAQYRRRVGVFDVRIVTRGAWLELTPPVPVVVLPGSIHRD